MFFYTALFLGRMDCSRIESPPKNMNRAPARWFIDDGFIFRPFSRLKTNEQSPPNAIQSLCQSLPYLGHKSVMQVSLVFLVLKAHFVQLSLQTSLPPAITPEIRGNTICDYTLSSHRCLIPDRRSRITSQQILRT
jgi:hypothetical protein